VIFAASREKCRFRIHLSDRPAVFKIFHGKRPTSSGCRCPIPQALGYWASKDHTLGHLSSGRCRSSTHMDSGAVRRRHSMPRHTWSSPAAASPRRSAARPCVGSSSSSAFQSSRRGHRGSLPVGAGPLRRHEQSAPGTRSRTISARTSTQPACPSTPPSSGCCIDRLNPPSVSVGSSQDVTVRSEWPAWSTRGNH